MHQLAAGRQHPDALVMCHDMCLGGAGGELIDESPIICKSAKSACRSVLVCDPIGQYIWPWWTAKTEETNLLYGNPTGFFRKAIA